ncbi:MAG: NRAMP family divalent metal transporter [Acidobacteriota bacterium]
MERLLNNLLPAGFGKSFGPGLMWAAAAVGVSHLVQSTRVGAAAGFALAGVILVAMILKYPFFEYGHRYAAATGTSLVEGYRQIGGWALWLYFLLTLVTSLIHQSALVLFTSYLIRYMLGLSWPLAAIGALLYVGCGLLLAVGRFRGFDLVVKVVMAILALSTLAAAAVALERANFSTLTLWPAEGFGDAVSLGFILALVGFMPSPIEVSVMSSLWTLAKGRASGHRASLAAARLDFDIGYIGTAILAFAFLLLGAVVMHGAGRQFSPEGTVFSVQLVGLYTSTLGGWTRPMVLVAAVTTMFSTVLIVIDGFPRAIERCLHNLRSGAGVPAADLPVGRGYWATMIVLGALTITVLSSFTGSLTAMVDFATIFTFMTAPVLGYLNLRAVNSEDVAPEHQPSWILLAVSYVGLVLLSGTALVYLGSKLL